MKEEPTADEIERGVREWMFRDAPETRFARAWNRVLLVLGVRSPWPTLSPDAPVSLYLAFLAAVGIPTAVILTLLMD